VVQSWAGHEIIGRATNHTRRAYTTSGRDLLYSIRRLSAAPGSGCRPRAGGCDPFHVIQLANRALDHVYGASRHGTDGLITSRQWRAARYALRAGAERLAEDKRQILNQFRRTRYQLWRAWELKEMLRDLYRVVEPANARAHLTAWLRSASLSRIGPFVLLARQLRRHFGRVVAAVEWGLSNSRLEGINGKIRVIQRRGYGYPSPRSLASMIYLCLGGVTYAAH
jgi:transposase